MFSDPTSSNQTILPIREFLENARTVYQQNLVGYENDRNGFEFLRNYWSAMQSFSFHDGSALAAAMCLHHDAATGTETFKQLSFIDRELLRELSRTGGPVSHRASEAIREKERFTENTLPQTLDWMRGESNRPVQERNPDTQDDRVSDNQGSDNKASALEQAKKELLVVLQ